MSDTSQGEGWWQEAGGKWYPPEAHPSYKAAASEVASEERTAEKNWFKRHWLITLSSILLVTILLATVPSSEANDAPSESTTSSNQTAATSTPAAEPESTTTTQTPAKTESTKPPIVTTSTTAAPTTTTQPPVSTGSLDNPLPVSNGSQRQFSFSDSGGTEWEGSIFGIVQTEPGRYNDELGTCYVIVGVLTPTKLDSGVVTNNFSTPGVELIANGSLIDSGVNDCDTADLEAVGYDWILNADTTVGTDFAFYQEVFIEGDDQPDLQAIVIGNPRSSDSMYFEPEILSSILTPPSQQGEPLSSYKELLPVGQGALGGFTYEERFGDTKWDGTIYGILETTTGKYNDDVGRCLLVIGSLTPTEIGDGTVTSGFSTPNIDVVAGGRIAESSVNDCNTDSVEAAGYDWILNAEVTVGTEYLFYQEIFIPGEEPVELEAIVIGSPSSDDSLLYEPTILNAIP